MTSPFFTTQQLYRTRAGLPYVQGMAHSAHVPDGRGCQRLPTRRLDVPRRRRAAVPLGVPPKGPFRRHHHAPKQPQLRVARQGLGLRRRSLYDRLRAIAQYDRSRRPGAVLVLVPSVWELRRTGRFCINNDLHDCYVAVESRDALERRDLRLWRKPTGGCSDSRTTRWRSWSPTANAAEGPASSRRSGSGPPCPAVPNSWRRLRRPSASHPRRNGRWISSPTIR